MSSNRSSLVNSLISSGSAASSKRKDDKLNEAGDAVGELFSDVDAGTRPVSDLDGLLDFLSGNAQQSSQQPAGALGAGPSASSAPDENEALNIILNSPNLAIGVKNAVRRLVVPNDPERIQVDDNGTPRQITSLQQEVANKESERMALDSDLKEERDESKPGSLAGKLKAATSAPATPAGSLDQAAIKAKVTDLRQAEENLDTTWGSTKVQGLTELQAVVTDLEQLVS